MEHPVGNALTPNYRAARLLSTFPSDVVLTTKPGVPRARQTPSPKLCLAAGPSSNQVRARLQSS